ncbi:hypothetical protein [Xanthobacter sediminis]
MSSLELDKLIILHLEDLEDAYRRHNVLGEKIAKKIDELMEKKIDELMENCAPEIGWHGKFDFNDSGSLWIAPTQWVRNAENDDALAWFSLEVRHRGNGPSGEQNAFWLSNLCGVGYGEYGLRFHQDILSPKKKWNSFLKENASELTNSGFELDDKPSIFLPIHIDASALAYAVGESDIETGLMPFQEAFEKIIKARPLFDAFIEKLNAQAGAA